jgi:hypothetical protein
MDYAWIAGSDPTLIALQEVIKVRPVATTVQKPPPNTVKEFFDALAANSGVTKPVSGLLIGSHANNDGWFQERFSPKQTRDTTYDEVIRVFTADSQAYRIPASLHTNATPPVKLRLIGCQAGKAPEMLRVLKRVMGGVVQVVGSKFFYEALTYPRHGGFISFRYGFEAYSPTQITKLADLVTLFTRRAAAHPADFRFIDGTPVPASQWAKWLPKRGFNNARHNFGASHGRLSQKIGKYRVLPLQIQTRHSRRQVAHTVPNMTQPTSLAAGRADLKAKLPNLAEFKTTHEFPAFRRKGNPTLADYVDSFDWAFQQNGTSTDCIGTRHDYSILAPVKVPQAGTSWERQRLMFHFYPAAGTSHPLLNGDFTEDQPSIFVTV